MGGDTDEPRPGFSHWESFKGQGVYYNPQLNINGKQESYTDSTYITDLLTEHAVDWLAKRDQSKPFFMYLSHKAVHSEFAPAKRHKGVYKNEPISLPSSFRTSDQQVSGKKRINNDIETEVNKKEPLKTDTYYGEGRTPDWQKMQRVSWHGVDYL